MKRKFEITRLFLEMARTTLAAVLRVEVENVHLELTLYATRREFNQAKLVGKLDDAIVEIGDPEARITVVGGVDW